MTTLEFDHFFIFTEPEAPAVEQVVALGLVEGQPNVHPGQGTACRRIFFHNAMLEFLWVRASQEVRSAAIAPTRLWERSRYHQTGYSPFGICFRTGSSSQATLPFETWAYRPPYLPNHLQIDVARNEVHPGEPMLFWIPFGGRPDSYPAEKRQPLAHPGGFREITGLTITIPGLETKSTAAETIEQNSFISFVNGAASVAEIRFDDARAGQIRDFRPALPLIFCW